MTFQSPLTDQPPAPRPSEELIFVVGELKGVVGGLTTSVNGLRRDVAQGNTAIRAEVQGVSNRVLDLEKDKWKRAGQTSVIAVIVSAGTAILVGVVTATVKGVLPR